MLSISHQSWKARRSTVALVSLAAIWILGLGTASAQDSSADTRHASASPGLSSDQIHTVVAEHRLEVRSCVSQDGLELPSRLDLVVDFLIGIDGSVIRATMVESNTENTGVDACVLDAVRNFEFPSPDNGREFAVRYPFLFITGG